MGFDIHAAVFLTSYEYPCLARYINCDTSSPPVIVLRPYRFLLIEQN